MGFIGKLIGGFFAFLGGILKTITGILGIGKSDYYMEAAPAVEAIAPAKVEPAKAEVAKAEAKAATAVQTAPAQTELAPAPLETVKAAVAPAGGSSNGSAKTTAKKSPKAAAEKPAAAKVAEPAPKGDQTFAPNYLMAAGSQNGRRRPGPSMDYFRNIAKQVKS